MSNRKYIEPETAEEGLDDLINAARWLIVRGLFKHKPEVISMIEKLITDGNGSIQIVVQSPPLLVKCNFVHAFDQSELVEIFRIGEPAEPAEPVVMN